MNKKKIIELLQERLGPIDGKYYQVVEGYATQAWQQLLHDVYRQDINGLDFYAKEFSGDDKVNVEKDDDRNLYYSDLPCPIVQFPDPSAGIRDISTEQATALEFCPCTYRDFMLKNTQTSGDLDIDVIYFVPRYNKVWYDRTMTDLIADYGVRMLLVPSFDYYSDTEKLPIPGGQAQLFISMVVEFAKGKPPENLINLNQI